ncbi:MAG: DUF4870 domain-containing protein [Candidatus Dormibacteraeota bacterium]|nr:DUF4870 domain-containing protein [Candidatus Dormibacteraeota bacterium]
MQNPPPGQAPPPSGYPQRQATGVDKRTGAFLSYLLTWITGIIMLFVGKDDPDIKFHAAQSVVFFGGLTVISIILNILSHVIGAFGVLYYLVNLAGVVYWIICLVKAWTGGGARFPIPLVGGVVAPYAEQLASSVN